MGFGSKGGLRFGGDGVYVLREVIRLEASSAILGPWNGIGKRGIAK